MEAFVKAVPRRGMAPRRVMLLCGQSIKGNKSGRLALEPCAEASMGSTSKVSSHVGMLS
jgi:hypothetical protein